MTDAERERKIERAQFILYGAQTAAHRREALATMEELISNRSIHQRRRMAKERNLPQE